ncbi:hypothetical protein MKX01_030747 [Papaver californicum]|nr:hypothetical protein MKX01_030747 [Papaver californicum]
MSTKLEVPGDTESFESKLCTLAEYQARTQLQLEVYQEQNQRQLEVCREQNQRQLEVLTTSLTRLIQTLEKNAEFVNNVAIHDNRVGLEVNSIQNLVEVVPSLPQPDGIQDTLTNTVSQEHMPKANEQESGQQDRESENQIISEEIIELHPQQQQLNDIIGVSPVDSSTSNHCSTFVLDHAYLPLYEATQEGNWEFARELLMDNPKLLTSVITSASDTVLLIAAENNRWTFVEELLKLMPPEALELKDTKYGNTALHIAAREGNKKVAEAIVNKNPYVTQIRDKDEKLPLLTAALFVSPGQKKTLEYLCEVTSDVHPNPFSGPDGATLICSILDAHFYDIALFLFQRYPNLVMEKTKYRKMWPLEVIAERPYAFQSGTNARSITVIQVDMTTPLCSLEATGDAENPSECFQDFSCSRDRGINAKFFSYFITHLTQGSVKFNR